MTDRHPSKNEGFARGRSTSEKTDARKARRVKSEMCCKSAKEEDKDKTTNISYYRRYTSEIGENRRKQINEIGGVFLNGINSIISKYEACKRNRRASTVPPVSIRQQSSIEGQMDLDPRDSEVLNDVEMELMYIEALYTIKYKIGTTTDEHLSVTQDLLDYVRQAFDFSPENHERLLLKVNEEKPPVVVLEVTIVEAKGLEAKDATGFSDPYCMLGIVPGSSGAGAGGAAQGRKDSGPKESTSSVSSDPSTPKTRTASQRKKTALDQIPVKFIKTTSVRKQTLNPVWNEKFRFDLEDVNFDRLHLDIWDHDDDYSVLEYTKKLNEVKGFKGLGRYFKQIAQSARTNSDESVDDFLGSLDLKLNDLPSTGLDQWFDLRNRSSRSRSEGQLHLKLNLATREDRGLSEEDILFETRQHRDLLSVFVNYEFNKARELGDIWSGELPKAASTILHQHAIQGDMTETQHAFCCWMAYSHQFRKKFFSWEILGKCLDDLDEKWSKAALFKEEEEALALSFERFINHCLKVASKQSEQLTVGSKMVTEKLDAVLSALDKLYSTKIFERCCPFIATLKQQLISIIKKFAEDRYNRLQSRRRSGPLDEESSGKELANLLDKVNSNLYTARDTLTPIYMSATEVDYFSAWYKQTHRLLSKDILNDLNVPLTSSDDLVAEGDVDFNEEMESAKLVLRLYLAVRQFYSFEKNLSQSDRAKLERVSYHRVFSSHLERWLSIIDRILIARVKYAVELDKIDEVYRIDKGEVKQSSSAIDVAFSISQVAGFWRNLRWYEKESAERFLFGFLKVISDCGVTYADLMFDKLKAAGYYDEEGQFDVSEQVCIILNDIEQVRRALQPLTDWLQLDKYGAARGSISADRQADDSNGASSATTGGPKSRLHQRMETADALMTAKIKQVTDRVSDKMRPDIKKQIFRLCWAPEKAQSHEAIDVLMNYLDSNLLTLNTNLLRANFDKILDSIWIEVLEEIQEISSKPDQDFQKAKWISQRLVESLKILYDFFHVDGKGLSESMINCTLYQEVKVGLELNNATVEELMEVYLEEKFKEQANVSGSAFGTLSVRIYFRPENRKLMVEVLKAKNVIPLDTNGFSDPFVVIDLWPRHVFPEEHQRQTNIVKKTLNPTFNETFEFQLSDDQLKCRAGCVVFTVMDHDYLSSNDFAGEAYMALNTICGISKQKIPGRSALTPVILPLMHWKGQKEPDLKISKVVAVLSTKEVSKTDLDFVKQRARLEEDAA